jgi:mannose-6-phosphate isomerase-like protein (cupin superfamily)
VSPPGDAYENPRTGTRFAVKEASRERLVFERRYPPSTGKAGPHLHLDFVQGWDVVSGTATVEIDGETRRLGPDESVEIQPPTKHRDPYNETADELTIRWHIEPMNEFVEHYMNAYCHLLSRDKLNRQDEFPLLQLFVILTATKAESYTASLPIGFQKATLPLLGAIGRIRGYRPSYGDPAVAQP